MRGKIARNRTRRNVSIYRAERIADICLTSNIRRRSIRNTDSKSSYGLFRGISADFKDAQLSLFATESEASSIAVLYCYLMLLLHNRLTAFSHACIRDAVVPKVSASIGRYGRRLSHEYIHKASTREVRDKDVNW